MASEPIPLSGLARRLVDQQVLTADAATKAGTEARQQGLAFVSYLVQGGLADARTIAFQAAEEFGVPLLDLAAFDLSLIPKDLVNDKLIRQHSALPLVRRGVRLFVAVSDPTNLQALDEIKFQTGVTTEAVLVEEDKLQTLIEKFLESKEDDGLGDLGDDDLEDLDMESYDEAGEEDETSAADETPIVRFVNKMLLDAIKGGSSDIHFEPYEKSYRIRFRTDGVLHEVSRPPQNLGTRLAARLKVMSEMDISERRVPQDGRIKMKLSKTKAIDFRVSTCPTLFGEKAVLRILDSDAAKLQIDQLGYEDFQKELFQSNLHKPYGMFLVTGPTGSGKTVSLYTGINILNQIETNISTAEDPVEINLPGVNQVQVDERTGMTFPKALKAFLRQDPDIILVGEIRDLETASIAVKAAQTGHMVMSTLHTNDCPQTLTRLQDMGIAPFAVATTINLITAQRLARRLHPDYKKPAELPKEALLEEGYTEEDIATGFKLFEPGDGGADCPSGYKGRTGIYQVMPISDAMKRLIIEGANAVQLADQSRSEGIWDIRRSGLAKAMSGVTSLAEINRVTVE